LVATLNELGSSLEYVLQKSLEVYKQPCPKTFKIHLHPMLVVVEGYPPMD
jgi:hypothetical protein